MGSNCCAHGAADTSGRASNRTASRMVRKRSMVSPANSVLVPGKDLGTKRENINYKWIKFVTELRKAPQARWANLPETMVAAGPPLKVRPSKGELRDLLADSFTLYVQGRFREKMVRSAGSPTASLRSLPRTRAGPVVNSSIMRISGRRFVWTS